MSEKPPRPAPRPRRVAPASRRSERAEPLLPPDEAIEEAYPAEETLPTADAERATAAWTVRLLYFAFAVVEILIALRVLLRLIAANPESGFARFIYATTAPFIAPFRNLVADPSARNGSTLEISSILAIVIYLLLNWLLARLFVLLLERPQGGRRHLRDSR